MPIRVESQLVQRAGGSDHELVQRIAGGDRDALAALYDRYAPLLLGVARRLLGDPREAEDLVHDVLLEVWRQAGDFDPDRGSPRSWIFVRLRSRALDRRKAAGVIRTVPLTAAQLERPGPDDDPSLAPDRARIRRALQALSPAQRTVLVLGYFEGLSSSEIAERIDVPIGTVKSRVAAALRALRDGLAGPEAEALP